MMAGPIRQPIDLNSLNRYISDDVPDIKPPIDVEQVSPHYSRCISVRDVLALADNTPTRLAVWIWAI